MGFTTACFIRKNTPELRKKLAELGYDICCCTEFKDACWLNTFLLNKTPSVHGIGYINEAEPLTLEKRLQCFLEDNARSEHPNIDCGTNEDLFLALAALRDNSNENQWFICKEDIWDENYNGEITIYVEEGMWMLDEDEDSYPAMLPSHFRKATVEEIIEHFKR